MFLDGAWSENPNSSNQETGLTPLRRMKMSENYSMDMKCSNCGIVSTKIFKKGQGCSGVYKCQNCGCDDSRAIKTSKVNPS
jgi:hypothetical protein